MRLSSACAQPMQAAPRNATGASVRPHGSATRANPARPKTAAAIPVGRGESGSLVRRQNSTATPTYMATRTAMVAVEYAVPSNVGSAANAVVACRLSMLESRSSANPAKGARARSLISILFFRRTLPLPHMVLDARRFA